MDLIPGPLRIALLEIDLNETLRIGKRQRPQLRSRERADGAAAPLGDRLADTGVENRLRRTSRESAPGGAGSRGREHDPAPARRHAEALACFPASTRRILVHFDVDVLECDDFPAADLLHHGGLTLAEAEEALRVFVESPRFGGLVVTEFNATRDPDQRLARRLVKALAGCFSAGS